MRRSIGDKGGVPRNMENVLGDIGRAAEPIGGVLRSDGRSAACEGVFLPPPKKRKT
jgi:hypothetical protein